MDEVFFRGFEEIWCYALGIVFKHLYLILHMLHVCIEKTPLMVMFGNNICVNLNSFTHVYIVGIALYFESNNIVYFCCI
jgi:hypothetical protein